ncbi:fatty acid synthase subunit alpha [Hirsutella rhossiliensis]|uniref:beta-ketoacyl-[acyl-carrier-protein] synthase I n=1 Tax=Hirsutella rhossiliensis TaxID=111463 RepID=A0A9P8N320_9HYPO|nr:fatty acid synthase subunit alpha [Hirsutella rhossiliensis]KAH0963792.1 fatty acid synthase subunit alpha [Hirsutella rhossiliensis]
MRLHQATSDADVPSRRDDQVARTLLIELLAHQFCFPVQWIDTQHLILGSRPTERIVEMGPGNTLVNMAKRTIAREYAPRDTAQNVSRQLLSFQHNLDKICYDQKLESPEIEPTTVAATPAPADPVAAAPLQSSAAPLFAAAPVEIQDKPASAIEVASTIICVGLKKPLDGIDLAKSIKALSGGRSTVQNEIIGDLAAEFGAIPEAAEDMPIDQLCSILQETFLGKLGAKSLSLIDKMMSQKSPGTFQDAGIRKHLRQRWGFGPGRQDTILLWAVTSQPQSRLQNEDDTKAFVNGIVHRYTNKTGLVLPDVSGSTAPAAAQVTVSAEALEFLEDRHKTVLEEQLGLYAKLLGLDLHAPEAAHAALGQRISELQGRLDEWNAEHGEAYASGLQAIFTPLKARVYDSWWNWAMQDLLELVSMAASAHTGDPDPAFDRLRRNVLQKTHPRLLSTMRHCAATTLNNSVAKVLRELLPECEASMDKKPVVYRGIQSMAPVTIVERSGKVVYSERPRSTPRGALDNDDQLLRLGRKSIHGWDYSHGLSSVLHRVLAGARTTGISLCECNVLVTGAGAGSIGCELVSKLLAAGAHVVVTSSSYSPKVTRFYQSLFAEHGSKGSKLVLVPFNQGSVRDIEALLQYIYDQDGLGMDLDYVVPFAAISENGRALDNIDSRSELAHRIMLTNTIRLMGKIKQQKQARGITMRPAQVILPLSPNHGTFGSDGLYAESKLGLEALFEKFHSEDWAEYLLVCGALIGWTRGTALMCDNDMVSEGIEEMGVRTYTQDEMALHVMALMDPAIVTLCTDEPLLADLSGGMARVADLKHVTMGIRDSINQLSEERRATTQEAEFVGCRMNLEAQLEPQADLELKFPGLPDWNTDIMPLAGQLQGMVDLDRVVVVTGFGEVGPWGNSRIRWDMELNGSLSLESCIELAWTMGLIKSHSGTIDGQAYSGWIDKETGKPIPDRAIRDKYESHMLKHSGIRYAEPKQNSPSWKGLEALHEVEISRDHDPVEVSNETAIQLKAAHGDNLHIEATQDTGRSRIVLKKGAKIMIPKLLNTQHTVAGQVPLGWNPSTYGIPEDIIAQVDPVTLYALVAAAEAFLTAGISDPYELYDYLHMSDVANCVGSGFGGISSMRNMFKERFRDRPAASDTLAESFISSGSAWINMLLLSAAGANKTPVGACATALESLDTAFDLIQAGKAKVCLVGGFDDMLKEISNEFANLRATVDADEDAARGREPAEMSRPATSTRDGFVESEGAGVQIVTSASVALQMGLPIHCVVALTRTAMDKAGRSIPAPGRGLIGAAAQKQAKYDSPLMSMAYRRRALRLRMQQAAEMRELHLSYMDDDIAQLKRQGYVFDDGEYRQQRLASIENDAKRDHKESLNLYGNQFWYHDSRISPIRGALAVWGLTVDDIDVVSFHGTSTKANERNEAAVINEQFKHLGRKKGNVVPVVCQKSLTGHPKGAAGAWMLDGCMQLMHDERIPGNRNADNIEAALQEYDYLVFPNKPINKTEIRAFMTQSFGFGQKGALAIGVNPKYLYATMQQHEFAAYRQKLGLRQRRATRDFQKRLFNNSVFQAKEKTPYAAGEAVRTLLDPEARFVS